MSPRGRMPPSLTAAPPGRLVDGLRALGRVLPHLWPPAEWRLRVRVVAALCCLLVAKVVNIAVPFLYKHAVDTLSGKAGFVVVPVLLVVAYGAARVLSQGFNEVRSAVFAKVEQRAIRRVALQAFGHLQQLSLRFHLERRTGGLSRAIARGTQAIDFLLTFILFNVVPTLIEILVVCGLLWRLYDWRFAAVTLATIVRGAEGRADRAVAPDAGRRLGRRGAGHEARMLRRRFEAGVEKPQQLAADPQTLFVVVADIDEGGVGEVVGRHRRQPGFGARLAVRGIGAFGAVGPAQHQHVADAAAADLGR